MRVCFVCVCLFDLFLIIIVKGLMLLPLQVNCANLEPYLRKPHWGQEGIHTYAFALWHLPFDGVSLSGLSEKASETVEGGGLLEADHANGHKK